MEKTLMSLVGWVKSHKKETVFLILILLLGAFLRLYRISEYMTFLADEGRDVLIVRKLITQGDLIFVGPGTSIGTMYLGPLYYYMMAPALFLSNLSPVGPAVMVALIAVATIFLVWKVAREWFGSIPAILATVLYSTSSVVIIFSRSSWNPNIMPFFSLLCLYSIWKAYKERKYWWLLVLGISFASVLQSHYLGLMLAPTIFAFWLMTIKFIKNDRVQINKFIKFTVFGFLGFLVLMLPLILFDFKHDFRNLHAMIDFASGSKENYSPSLEDTLSKTLPMFKLVTTRLFFPKFASAGLFFSIALLLGGLITLTKKKSNEMLLIFLWFGFGVIGLALLRQDVYDHYFGFLFPAPFLLLSGIVQNLNKKIILVVGTVLLLFNLYSLPILGAPNMQYPRSVLISQKILEESNGKKFHLAAIAETNNRDTYLYNLTNWGAPVVDIDPQNFENTIVDQLFVVCEKIPSECDPTHDPSSWITSFGWSRIENSWEVWGYTIYKLVHTEEWQQKQN